MTGFEALGGWHWQEDHSCFCFIFAPSTHCEYDFIPFTSCQFFNSAINPCNFVVNIILLPLSKGFQAFHMFILGPFWKLYKFSILTKDNSSSILEPSIVFYFITIQTCSQSSCLRELKTVKTWENNKKNDISAVSPRDTDIDLLHLD